MTYEIVSAMGAGLFVGLFIAYLIIALSCKHEWEHVGQMPFFHKEGDMIPVARYDLYTCNKCKKNKREKI